MFHTKNTDNQPISAYKPVDSDLYFKVIQENIIPVKAKYQIIAKSATECGKSTVNNSIGVYVPAISKYIAEYPPT